MESSVYDRLGGSSALRLVTEAFYQKVLADEELAPYFAFVAMDRLTAMQASFLTMAFGGPDQYEGRGLREAHARLRDLDDRHFDKVVGYLADTLHEFGASDADITGGQARSPRVSGTTSLNR